MNKFGGHAASDACLNEIADSHRSAQSTPLGSFRAHQVHADAPLALRKEQRRFAPGRRAEEMRTVLRDGKPVEQQPCDQDVWCVAIRLEAGPGPDS
jgi:hypothetical protein